MLEEVIIAGFGGQGIMLMGKLLAYGAIYESLEVTFYPSYGPEMRGGTANCTVVVSDGRIGSPVRNRFSCLMAMNQASADKFSERVRTGGRIIYNRSLVKAPPTREGLALASIAANSIAAELGSPQAANMVAMGALARVLGRITVSSLVKGLARVLPPYRHDAIPRNAAAIHRGFEALELEISHAESQA